jgi:hypothetical protein
MSHTINCHCGYNRPISIVMSPAEHVANNVVAFQQTYVVLTVIVSGSVQHALINYPGSWLQGLAAWFCPWFQRQLNWLFLQTNLMEFTFHAEDGPHIFCIEGDIIPPLLDADTRCIEELNQRPRGPGPAISRQTIARPRSGPNLNSDAVTSVTQTGKPHRLKKLERLYPKLGPIYSHVGLLSCLGSALS